MPSGPQNNTEALGFSFNEVAIDELAEAEPFLPILTRVSKLPSEVMRESRDVNIQSGIDEARKCRKSSPTRERRRANAALAWPWDCGRTAGAYRPRDGVPRSA